MNNNNNVTNNNEVVTNNEVVKGNEVATTTNNEVVVKEQEQEEVKGKCSRNLKEEILTGFANDLDEAIKFNGKVYFKHEGEVYKLSVVKYKGEIDFEKLAQNQEKIDKKLAEIQKLEAQIAKLQRI